MKSIYCALLTGRRSILLWKWPLRKSPSNDIPNSNKTVGFQKFRAIFHGRCFRSKNQSTLTHFAVKKCRYSVLENVNVCLVQCFFVMLLAMKKEADLCNLSSFTQNF